MEQQHPIPQNVTSFQFKLVGDMTLKQFTYLASGMVIAYIFFVFVVPSQPLLAWPIIVLSSFIGIAFAFIPIADRPLDYWLVAFLRAIYSPTKRSWSKNNVPAMEYLEFNNRFANFKNQAFSNSQNNSAVAPAPVITQPNITAKEPSEPKVLPSQEELAKTVELARQAQTLQVQIIESEKRLHQIKENRLTANQGSTENINQILENLQSLMNEAGGIKKQLAQVTHQSDIVEPTQKVQVNVISAQLQKPTQIVLTSQPNVINGIIADSNRNYLDGVVVVIYDKGGLPVRALKTNKLGQFSGSTPLPNDTYTIQLEKDNFTFDMLQIELKGEVLPPLTIQAKNL